MQIAEQELSAILKERFGHHAFRPMQQQIIADALAGRDVFTLMPTGGGKSLCYQLPAVTDSGVTVVVSPLIALMQDQVKALEANGIAATVLNSSVDAREITRREGQAASGHFSLIYLAPERLMSPAGSRLLDRLDVRRFAIDEAHCISEWGHDFRPDYRLLGQLRQRFARVPIMALTATATPRVADDIVRQLHLRDPAIYRGRFERENLHYEVRPKQKVTDQVLAYLRAHPHAEGIIYCHSRASVEALAAKLSATGIAALPYHAGLPHDVRQHNQHEFVYGDARVIVATIAFGMGVDKPDVRFVMHADLPRNLEAYYQETGRAGRDGLRADCILFFSYSDRSKIERFINEKPSEHEREVALEQLQQMIAFAYTTRCRCVPLLGYFGEQRAQPCGHCDNCVKPPELEDATENARKLLSAVARTGQRFGLRYVIGVLRGDEDERCTRHGHDQLSVFGIGADQPVAYWRRLGQHLVEQGQLALSQDEYRTTSLTGDSRAVLRGEVQVQLARPRSVRPAKAAKQRVLAVEDLSPADEPLFEALRSLRRDLAQAQGVPPYVIFSDAVLRQMAQRRPASPEQLLGLAGVGPYKMERYGPQFLDCIAGHSRLTPSEP